MTVGHACEVIEAPPPPPTTGPGTPCDPAAAGSCPDPLYPTCKTALSGESYCTATGCSEGAPCPEGYQCSGSGAESFCRRPYSGQGMRCTASDQCSSYDANACATLISQCVVANCPTNPCDPGYSCFPASQFMPGVPDVCIESSIIP